MTPDVEYVVAGAGPAGATIARILALQGKAVLLVDPGVRATNRLELLSPSSLSILAALDLLPILEELTIARPCPGIRRRWGSPRSAYDDFFGHRHGRGYVIDRLALDRRLRELAAAANAQILEGKVELVGNDGRRPLVRAVSGADILVLRPRIVFDATGRPASLARRAGAHWEFHERLLAVLAGTQAALGTKPDSWLDVESEDGTRNWTYRIGGPDGREETWHVGPPTTVQRDPSQLSVDASSGMLNIAAGEQWIAVGDACACFDPLTSQGLAHAFSTAMVAAGIALSDGGLTKEAAEIYSTTVRDTFIRSERERRMSYSLKVEQQSQ